MENEDEDRPEEDDECSAPNCPEWGQEECEECGGLFCLFHMSGFICDYCYEARCEDEEEVGHARL